MTDIPHTDNITVAMIAAALGLLEEAYKHVSVHYWPGSDEERRQKVLNDFQESYKTVKDTVGPPKAKAA